MRAFPSRMLTILAALVVLAVTTLSASTVSQFNLAEMSRRAQKIYVGTVRSATEGTIAVGGGQLAVVTYQLTVDEDLLGETAMVKGERVAEIRMLGKQKSVQVGSMRFVSPLPDMPVLSGGPDLSRLHDATKRASACRRRSALGRVASGCTARATARWPSTRSTTPGSSATCSRRLRPPQALALRAAANRRTDAVCRPPRADRQPRRSQEVGHHAQETSRPGSRRPHCSSC